MPTEKPRYSITIEESTLEKIETYQKEHQYATRSRATVDLIQKGLDILNQKEKTAPEDGDGLSPLDAQLMDLLRHLSDDQKRFLLAQIETLVKSQE